MLGGEKMEYIQIIDSNEKTLAYLNDIESGTIHQVINGEYTLSFQCLISALKTPYLYNSDNMLVYNNDWFKVV